MLIESLILYPKLRKYLEAIGLKVNPYYIRVSNKMIRNKKMTITWHVHDFKVSHDYKDIVQFFIQWTKETYEDITKIYTSRRKIHDYLSMNPDDRTTGEVKFYMKECIDKIIEYLLTWKK